MADLSFSFTVSEEDKTRIIDGVSYQNQYQDQVVVDGELVDNPESKGAFCKRLVKGWIKANVRAYEANQAAETARLAKMAEVNAIDIAD